MSGGIPSDWNWALTTDQFFKNMRAIETIDKEKAPALTEGEQCDISGLVNGEWKMYLRSAIQCVVYRVPIITPDDVQLVIDIWCNAREQEPRYWPDWRLLQWTVIRGAVFKKKSTAYGVEIYQFKYTTGNPGFRFIWISHPCRYFWQSPVNEPEDVTERREFLLLNRDHGNVRGILRRSEGSCFGKFVAEREKTLHTHQLIGGLFFAEVKEFMIQYRRRVVRRFYEFMMIDGKLAFDDPDRYPLFHKLVSYIKALQ